VFCWSDNKPQRHTKNSVSTIPHNFHWQPLSFCLYFSSTHTLSLSLYLVLSHTHARTRAHTHTLSLSGLHSLTCSHVNVIKRCKSSSEFIAVQSLNGVSKYMGHLQQIIIKTNQLSNTFLADSLAGKHVKGARIQSYKIKFAELCSVKFRTGALQYFNLDQN